MFKQVNNMAPIVMDDTVHNRDIHFYFTRSDQNVHTTFRRTVKVAKSFLNMGSQYYYNLPVNIRGVHSCIHMELLKNCLKNHIFSQTGAQYNRNIH